MRTSEPIAGNDNAPVESFDRNRLVDQIPQSEAPLPHTPWTGNFDVGGPDKATTAARVERLAKALVMQSGLSHIPCTDLALTALSRQPRYRKPLRDYRKLETLLYITCFPGITFGRIGMTNFCFLGELCQYASDIGATFPEGVTPCAFCFGVVDEFLPPDDTVPTPRIVWRPSEGVPKFMKCRGVDVSFWGAPGTPGPYVGLAYCVPKPSGKKYWMHSVYLIPVANRQFLFPVRDEIERQRLLLALHLLPTFMAPGAQVQCAPSLRRDFGRREDEQVWIELDGVRLLSLSDAARIPPGAQFGDISHRTSFKNRMLDALAQSVAMGASAPLARARGRGARNSARGQ